MPYYYLQYKKVTYLYYPCIDFVVAWYILFQRQISDVLKFTPYKFNTSIPSSCKGAQSLLCPNVRVQTAVLPLLGYNSGAPSVVE